MATTTTTLNLGYSNASFQGTYGFSLIVGPQAATGVGIAISDGNGNFYGFQKVETNGTTITFNYTGTYQVYPDGTGDANVTLTADTPGGPIVQQSQFDYVVLQAVEQGTTKVGTELQGLTRLPEGGVYGVTWFKRLTPVESQPASATSFSDQDSLATLLNLPFELPIEFLKQFSNAFSSFVETSQPATATVGSSSSQAAAPRLDAFVLPAFQALDQLQRSFVDTFTKLASTVPSSPSSSTPAAYPAPIQTQNPAHDLKLGYSNATFSGKYGFSIIYGPRAAVGVGIAISDGRGHFHGIQKINTNGQHIVFNFTGTYNMTANGTGTAAVTLTPQDPAFGGTQQGNFDYVVLQSDSKQLGTELQGLDITPQSGAYGVSWFKTIP